MRFEKTHHEQFAQFFETPTRENLRDLLRLHTGETDNLDFKAAWPEPHKMAKHVLAMSNSGGGAIVIGVEQKSDNSIVSIGLEKLCDKADFFNSTKKFIPDSVKYEIFDFLYNDSEYQTIKGLKFQVLMVEFSEKILPVLALNDGPDIRANAIYIRNGTQSCEASKSKLEHLINLRIESGYSSSHTLSLTEHIEQLRNLYDFKKQQSIDKIYDENILLLELIGDPYERFYDYIDRLIEKKKSIINEIISH